MTDKVGVSFSKKIFIVPYELTKDTRKAILVMSGYNVLDKEEKKIDQIETYTFAKYPSKQCVISALKLFNQLELIKKYFPNMDQNSQ